MRSERFGSLRFLQEFERKKKGRSAIYVWRGLGLGFLQTAVSLERSEAIAPQTKKLEGNKNIS